MSVDLKKKAWSHYFSEYVRCVKYVSDKEWYFVFDFDTKNRNVMKAVTPYSLFEWV